MAQIITIDAYYGTYIEIFKGFEGRKKLSRKMPPRIALLLAISSTLFLVAHGQHDTPECRNALTTFTQDAACFRSPVAANVSRISGVGHATFFSLYFVQLNSSLQQPLAAFFNDFCSSQHCVQLYTDAVKVCVGPQEQVQLYIVFQVNQHNQ